MRPKKPRISFLAAVSDNGVIGKDGGLPWDMPADMRFFKEKTMGKPVVMGRKTLESCPAALPGRHNIVITRDADYDGRGASVVHSLAEAFALAQDEEEIIVIGGTRVFEEAHPFAHRIYLTEIHADVEGDTFYPDLDYTDWEEVRRVRHEADDENPYPYSFVVLEISDPLKAEPT